MQEQATAKEIILAIVDNMHASAEPLLYSTLLPSLYDIYLHNDDYERLQGIWPRIVNETRQALDDELARLNGGVQLPKFLKFLPVSDRRPMKYERAAEDWYINVYRNTDEDTARGDIVIDSRFALPSLPQFGAGSKTKRITTLRSSGQTRTLRTVYQDAKDPSAPATEGAAQPIAKISYEDEDGTQVYWMTKNQIVIGRGGVDYWVDLRLSAPADVSREHLRLKRDETGQFSIKDLSKFGTSVNGKRIESSVEAAGSEKPDKDIWAPLPGKARIGLADVIYLDFEAL